MGPVRALPPPTLRVGTVCKECALKQLPDTNGDCFSARRIYKFSIFVVLFFLRTPFIQCTSHAKEKMGMRLSGVYPHGAMMVWNIFYEFKNRHSLYLHEKLILGIGKLLKIVCFSGNV